MEFPKTEYVDAAKLNMETSRAPCPFCGVVPEIEVRVFETSALRTSYLIACRNKGGCAVLPYIAGSFPDTTAAAWNRRAPTSAECVADHAKLDRVRVIIAEYRGAVAGGVGHSKWVNALSDAIGRIMQEVK